MDKLFPPSSPKHNNQYCPQNQIFILPQKPCIPFDFILHRKDSLFPAIIPFSSWNNQHSSAPAPDPWPFYFPLFWKMARKIPPASDMSPVYLTGGISLSTGGIYSLILFPSVYFPLRRFIIIMTATAPADAQSINSHNPIRELSPVCGELAFG